MNQVIIPDTSLCAIVRDEMMNPAGGIIDFVDSTIPFMEAGVIVDTGSIDGTREALEELSKKYPNLEIYNHQFDGFANSRNYSLGKVKTKRAFVLDADERLTKEDFIKLKDIIEKEPADAYRFFFLEVYPQFANTVGGLNPRLFNVKNKKAFKDMNGTFEFLDYKRKCETHVETAIEIKHFVPSDELKREKRDIFYKMIEGCAKSKDYKGIKSPLGMPFSKEWKAYNPKAKKINDRKALFA